MRRVYTVLFLLLLNFSKTDPTWHLGDWPIGKEVQAVN